MGKGNIVVIEGACDGIGKSTQFDMLKDVFDGNYITHHFPTYNSLQGSGVEEYLKGNLGEISELSPYFIHNLYAFDRAYTWNTELKPKYDEGSLVLLDRYTSSSIIYQSCLIDDIDERKKFMSFVEDYEYNKIGIGKPDSVIFLTAPFDLVTKLREERNKNGNNAFKGSEDIHEKDINHMKKVYENALLAAKYLNWDIIECNDGEKFKSKEEIHEEILSKLKEKKLSLQMDK